MTRITPRTCLYPLTGSLLLTFGLSIGLTYRSNHHCYAAVCGEWLFPLQARLHVVVWYLWLAISVTVLGIRAFQPDLRRILGTPFIKRKVPLFRKSLTLSGVLVTFWTMALYGMLIGVWWVPLDQYFAERGKGQGVIRGNNILAAIAQTGHMADVTMGLALIPVSRHSALGSFFKLSHSTTLAFHMLTAYTLFILTFIHGILYVSWVPIFQNLSDTLRTVFPVLNPTYLYHEVWPGNHSSLAVWRASLIFSGIIGSAIFLLIFITTLPPIRLKHFNVFYFTHFTAILAVILLCLHASTIFYCCAPGLAMWILDWGMRLYELRKKIMGSVSTIGNGWYTLSLPLPRNRLDGCACKSPLAHFYIQHSDSSIRELHPFTTITHLATQNTVTPKDDDLDIQFLFRKSTSAPPPLPEGFSIIRFFRGSPKQKKTQWTVSVAATVDKEVSTKQMEHPQIDRSSSTTLTEKPVLQYSEIPIGLRLEGPYFTAVDPSIYRTVVCLVAGTGVSGGIAIANAFANIERRRAEGHGHLTPTFSSGDGDHCDECGAPNKGESKGSQCVINSVNGRWEKCMLVWSVKQEFHVDLPFLTANPASTLQVQTYLTGAGQPRLNMEGLLGDLDKDGGVWVYISGPSPFIAAAEKACKATEGVEYYAARWDI